MDTPINRMEKEIAEVYMTIVKNKKCKLKRNKEENQVDKKLTDSSKPKREAQEEAVVDEKKLNEIDFIIMNLREKE
ncbi:14474_t:CDS:2 [Dentiscutata heterogama]|uniref:14474_t:CDS:1 n=1 Tax=Dentiscutata heterogama TaxID=1316150 RepID=A0ACA9K8G2_9GLOM|nr:14474_t:CDS:2 [Dentiscutata heterogama]